MPSFTPTVVTLDALILREREWKRLTASQGSSPRAPPRSPSSHGRWALRPTRAAHSTVQMRAHLSAAHFVNESSPVIDSFPLHLAIVERHCSLHRVLCSSHPWRGSVAHNASNFLQSAPRYAYLSSDVLPRKNFPLSVSATVVSDCRHVFWSPAHFCDA